MEWIYGSEQDASFFRELNSSIGWAGGALNANVPTPGDSGAAQDVDGEKLFAPWMKSWGVKWSSTASPLTRDALRYRAKSYIKMRVRSIQFDDPLLQLRSADWGGDFSPASLAGFREYLKQYPAKEDLGFLESHDLNSFDYKEYLRNVHGIHSSADYLRTYQRLPSTALWLDYLTESVRAFFLHLRQFLDDTAGYHVALSMNLDLLDRPSEANPQFFLTEFIDYVIAETRIKDEADIYARAATLRALGLGYVPSIVPSSIAEGRRAIATFYALGANPLVPWDVYAGNDADGKPVRYFGDAAEFGDLYRFVRKNANLFDGWETAPVAGIVIPIDRYHEREAMALVRKLVSAQVPFAFVPTGGKKLKYGLVRQQLEHFGVLITTNPSTDFSQTDLDILSSLNVQKLRAKEATDGAMRSLTPLFSVDNAAMPKLIARGQNSVTRRNELLIHVIAAPGNVLPNQAPCSRSFGIQSSMMAGKLPKKIQWYALGLAPQEAKWGKMERGVRIDLPSCTEWGLVHLELGN